MALVEGCESDPSLPSTVILVGLAEGCEGDPSLPPASVILRFLREGGLLALRVVEITLQSSSEL